MKKEYFGMKAAKIEFNREDIIRTSGGSCYQLTTNFPDPCEEPVVYECTSQLLNG